ncbi:MAG: pseudouridine synthase, partial [Planctomycetota bacterium]|nr:pseudouridine synthase [Planctomycetota bacterium]
MKNTPIEHIDPEILYEEGKCVVVCKPPGLLTQAPPGIDSIEVRIKEHVRRRTGKLGKVYLGVPHRLDRPASGAMVFGLNRRATQRLSEQFELRTVRKTYWALVAGRVEPERGTWTDQIRKVPDEARAEIVAADHPHGRPAVLHYRVLAQCDWGSCLEIELETGRTHQIRVQAATRGHAVLGDAQYGSTIAFGPQHDDERLRAIALHARRLEFIHTATKEPISVEAPVLDAWGEFVEIEAVGTLSCLRTEPDGERKMASSQKLNDPFNARVSFDTGNGAADLYRISRLEDAGLGTISQLPYSIRVLLESLLRNCDGYEVGEEDVKNLAGWTATDVARVEIPFKPARVVLQDFTGVPAVVDLAAMRSAMQRMGGDPKLINPLIPVDLTIDHSVQVDYFASDDALVKNIDIEFHRNDERYRFLRWGQKAFDNFRVV